MGEYIIWGLILASFCGQLISLIKLNKEYKSLEKVILKNLNETIEFVETTASKQTKKRKYTKAQLAKKREYNRIYRAKKKALKNSEREAYLLKRREYARQYRAKKKASK